LFGFASKMFSKRYSDSSLYGTRYDKLDNEFNKKITKIKNSSLFFGFWFSTLGKYNSCTINVN